MRGCGKLIGTVTGAASRCQALAEQHPDVDVVGIDIAVPCVLGRSLRYTLTEFGIHNSGHAMRHNQNCRCSGESSQEA